MLCKKALNKFKEDLFWILGNRNMVRIWNDSILGKSPLHSHSALHNFKIWTDNHKISSLWDISNWELSPPYRWTGWNLLDYSEELKEEKDMFLSLLSTMDPMSRKTKDKHGWGWRSRHYTAAHGYSLFSAIPNAFVNPLIWKKIGIIEAFLKLICSSRLLCMEAS